MSQELQKAVQALTSSYKIHAIILFGSRARGNHLKTSDIDLIVVSNKFKQTPFVERPTQVLKALYKEGIVAPIDLLCYTPQEFEKKKQEIGIVREALKTAKTLAK